MSAKSFILLLLQFFNLIHITFGGLIPVSDLIRGPAFWTDRPIPSTGLQHFGTGTATFAIPHFTLDTTDFSYPLPTTTGVSSVSPTAILTVVVETVVTSDVTIQPPVISTSAVEPSATPTPSNNPIPLNPTKALDVVVDVTHGSKAYSVLFFITPYGKEVHCPEDKDQSKVASWPRNGNPKMETPWDIGGKLQIKLPGVGDCEYKNEGVPETENANNKVNYGRIFCNTSVGPRTVYCDYDKEAMLQQPPCGGITRNPLITCPFGAPKDLPTDGR